MATPRSKDPQPKSIIDFNGNNNSSYQAFENEDGSVWLYINEVPVGEFSELAEFEKWSVRDGD